MTERVNCFDLDGTLTHHGHDLFFHTMNSVLSKTQFCQISDTFRAGGNNLQTATHVISMCHDFLMATQINWELQLFEKGYSLMDTLIGTGLYHEKAFGLIKSLHAKPFNRVIISTANFKPIVLGAKQAMVDRGLLPIDVPLLYSELGLSGVGVINAGLGKGESLKKWLIANAKSSKPQVDVYCDDPEGTDSGLVQYADRVFIAPECFL